VVKLPLAGNRLPDVAALGALITPRSRVLAIGQMSNVTGGCPDLALAIRQARAAGMVVMVDGAQGRCISRRTSRRWISTFMLFQAISSTGRPASARCMAKANGWRRCRRGSAAEK
jgi:selenocysteine lyase/cysteine desulfurase